MQRYILYHSSICNVLKFTQQGRGNVQNDGEADIEMFNSDCTRKRVKVVGSGGILPQENFEIIHLRRSILVYFQ